MSDLFVNGRAGRRELFKQPVSVGIDLYPISGGRSILSAKLLDHSPWGVAMELVQAVTVEDLFVLSMPVSLVDGELKALYRVVSCAPLQNQRWTIGAEIVELDPTATVVNRYLKLATARTAPTIRKS